MKSAEEYVLLRGRGLSHKDSIAHLRPFTPHYRNRIPATVYRVVHDYQWRVFPIFGAEWARRRNQLLHLASNDLDTVKLWGRSRPNWAVATGPQSGLITLGANGRAAQESLLELCSDDWDWIGTLRANWGDQRYVFFSWPDGWVEKPLLSPLAAGLRLFGAGQSVLLPSWNAIHRGQLFYFVDPDAPVLPVPNWLRKRLIDREPYSPALRKPVSGKSPEIERL